MMIEMNDADIDHKVDVFNRARAALVAAGAPAGDLYPEYTAERIVTGDQVESSIEDSAGNWDFSSSTTSPAEVEDVLRALQNSPMDIEDLQPVGDDKGWV